MSRKLKKLLVRISIAAVLFLAGMLLPLPVYGGFETNIILLVAAYLLVGYDIILKAATNIGHGQVFDENFLMTIATFAAFGTGEIAECNGNATLSSRRVVSAVCSGKIQKFN